MGRSLSALLAWVVGLVPLVGCRIAEPKPRWVEAHGQGHFKAIAASSRGLAALGAASGVYQVPGDWGRSWIAAWSGSGTSLAATDSATFALDASGGIWQITTYATRWRTVVPTEVSALFTGPGDELLGVVDGVLRRVTQSTFEDFPCALPPHSVAVRGQEVFVLGADGGVQLAKDGRCETVDLDGPVESIASTTGALYVLRGGTPYEVVGKKSTRLPRPRVIRSDEPREVALKSLSASTRTVWGLSVEGNVFQLVMP